MFPVPSGGSIADGALVVAMPSPQLERRPLPAAVDAVGVRPDGQDGEAAGAGTLLAVLAAMMLWIAVRRG